MTRNDIDGFGLESTFVPQERTMQEAPQVALQVAACEHKFKFAHAAHYGHFDIYECTSCGTKDLKYWSH